MRVGDLIEHLLKIDPEAEIMPLWEGHCPSDFGGMFRAMPNDRLRQNFASRDLVYLECEDRGDGTWDLTLNNEATEPRP